MDPSPDTPARPDVSVVIPARNEAGTVAEVIRRVDASLAARSWSREILVGDSASTDDTVEAALATGLPVRVVSVSEPGKGRILTRSFREGRGRVVAFIDADLDLLPEDLPRLIQAVRDGSTCAVAVKTAAARAARPVARRIGSRVVNAAARLFLRTGLTDHQTGMKAFAGDALQRVLPDVVETGWLWDTEVLWRIQRAGGSVVEVPVTLLDARGSGFRGVSGIDGARQLVALDRRLALVPGPAGPGSERTTAGEGR